LVLDAKVVAPCLIVDSLVIRAVSLAPFRTEQSRLDPVADWDDDATDVVESLHRRSNNEGHACGTPR